MSSASYKLIGKCFLSILFACILSTTAANANTVIPVSTFDVAGANEGYLLNSIETIDNCSAYFEGTAHVANCRDGEVPTEAAKWLFLIALITFVRLSSKRKF